MAQTEKSLIHTQKSFVNFLKRQGKASATILAYGKDIEQLTAFLAEQEITQATAVKSEHIEAFKKSLGKKGYLSKSISRKLNSIKTFFRFLKERKIINEDPATMVSHPKYEIAPPRILTKMEYRALRDAARDDIRMAAIIELLLQTGLRIGELARLELGDVKPKEIKVKAYESHSDRSVPLNQAARKALDRYLAIRPKTSTKVVFITKTGRPLLVRNMRAIINRYFRLAGIEKATVNCLRHTFIIHQLTAGVSVALVQKLVGHKRLSTTEKYLQMVQNQVKETVKLEEL